jgi:hypothetical protein
MSSYRPFIFKTLDRYGDSIVLGEGAWSKINLIHKDIQSIEEIKDTIEQPDYIAIDKDKSTTRNYYKENAVIKYEYEKFTVVYVNFERQTGNIVSAQRKKKVHPKDQIIYPKR